MQVRPATTAPSEHLALVESPSPTKSLLLFDISPAECVLYKRIAHGLGWRMMPIWHRVMPSARLPNSLAYVESVSRAGRSRFGRRKMPAGSNWRIRGGDYLQHLDRPGF